MTDPAAQTAPDIVPRPPAQVMRLARLGAFHQHRLSFLRILLRRAKAESWRYDRRVFDVDARGVGHAVLSMHTPKHVYSLVAFAHDLPPEMRSDRVIATAWDATFALFDGLPTEAEIADLRANIPLQEAGRVGPKVLSVSRANRSVRLWDYVVGCLAAGHQPDAERIEEVGYLMRTTAVYGSGKLGAADREATADRPEFQPPFQIEMLAVWLIRTFVMDLVEHMARATSPQAVPLDPALRRRFGIGNSTGLGMAPYLINHPVLLNNWIGVREEALARVRRVQTATPEAAATFRSLVARARLNVDLWRSAHPLQLEKLAELRADLDRLLAHLDTADLVHDDPWDRLWRWAEEALGLEGQEAVVSLLLEPYGDLVDGMDCCMAADEAAAFRIDATMSVGRLAAILRDTYGWALAIDWDAPPAQARAWYTSAEKLEPRLGERWAEPVGDYEQPLSPGRDAARLAATLADWSEAAKVAEVLLRHPEHRHIIRRAQIAARHPYAEIRDNTIGAEVLPIDLLRAKLAFFGAQHFDPRSDRWVRISLYPGAPFPDELASADPDDWTYPTLPA
ncbi:MAG: hypothetical protein GC146_03415 [Limimaricola sp.]|uniref:hypothetical protein n=1 Tax=Limimaricola sp. TaxID=2211665 RepID=UPI001D65C19E|nr:hypothetical protein [Limimaricola sp.]MBI1416249.1 hypothetical protein [Limimaricola sp.]